MKSELDLTKMFSVHIIQRTYLYTTQNTNDNQIKIYVEQKTIFLQNNFNIK